MFGFYQTYFICLYTQGDIKISCTKCVASGKQLRSLAPNDLHWQWEIGSTQPTGLWEWDSRSPLHTWQGESGRKGVWGAVGRTKRAMSLQNVKDPPEDLEPCLFTDALCHQQLCCSSPPPLPFLLRIPHRYRVSPSLASLSLPCSLSQLRPCRLASSVPWIFPFKVHHRVISHSWLHFVSSTIQTTVWPLLCPSCLA